LPFNSVDRSTLTPAQTVMVSPSNRGGSETFKTI